MDMIKREAEKKGVKKLKNKRQYHLNEIELGSIYVYT